ncbi:hypothetical protein MNBD_GAMMA12-1915 [hydrothermal vent metagenome]|uniref:Activator of Hsp90 ATPase homologue 1/2-like C-terminal domain-containing protein n=1 Tax=hydrothermal vent metagenome TaxID=652676 RepID=A0A3B0Z603_9ZZZZ
MNTSNANKGFELKIKRIFEAPPQVIFDAWTNPQNLTQWFAPDPGMTVEIDKLELKEGGKYQFKMIEHDTETYIVVGEYLTISPPKQLIFTWKWVQGDDRTEMLVTLDFKNVNGNTELSLLHEKLPDEYAKDHHNQGWVAIFDRLSHIIKTSSLLDSNHPNVN